MIIYKNYRLVKDIISLSGARRRGAMVCLAQWLGRGNFFDWIKPLGFMFKKFSDTFRLLNNYYQTGRLGFYGLLI